MLDEEIKVIYLDKFNGDFITEKDDIVPPERYLEIKCHDKDIIIEKYHSINDFSIRIDFSYTLKARDESMKSLKLGLEDLIAKERKAFFKSNNCVKSKYEEYCLIVPKSIFEEYKLLLEK